jgi:hypothetical protein
MSKRHRPIPPDKLRHLAGRMTPVDFDALRYAAMTPEDRVLQLQIDMLTIAIDMEAAQAAKE